MNKQTPLDEKTGYISDYSIVTKEEVHPSIRTEILEAKDVAQAIQKVEEELKVIFSGIELWDNGLFEEKQEGYFPANEKISEIFTKNFGSLAGDGK